MLCEYALAMLDGFSFCDDFGAKDGFLVYDLAQCSLSRPDTGPVFVGCQHVDIGAPRLCTPGSGSPAAHAPTHAPGHHHLEVRSTKITRHILYYPILSYHNRTYEYVFGY
jgi:hypothetical protein